jgi:hypothetical protein
MDVPWYYFPGFDYWKLYIDEYDQAEEITGQTYRKLYRDSGHEI